MKDFQLFPKRFGLLPYVFLIYLIMPLYYVVMEAGIKAVIGYILLTIFLVSYQQLYWIQNVKLYVCWIAVQIAIVVVLSVFYEPYNLFMGFFPSHFIGWFEKKKHFHIALVIFGVVMLITNVIVSFQGFNFLFFLPFLFVMIISPYGVRSMNRRIELEMQLDQANEQLKMLVKREERVRIARDLHDTLGHTLSLITLQSQLVQRLADKNPDRVKQEAKEIEMTSRSALQQVRELVSDMRAISIKEELAQMQQIIEAAGIAFHSDIDDSALELSLLQQNIIGLCLREAGTNIVRHSNASQCQLSIKKGKGHFIIRVDDDGIGFNEHEVKGNGLKGMKERLELINGELFIRSEQGTTIIMRIPIVLRQEKEEIAI
ncbi:sensor histidine kinase [Lederbergia graminis]|uniref:histidine kinase n=1 Tax=Lederbergia graminis TaxID=735518 RepID=A0ABW0LJE8_9BACI